MYVSSTKITPFLSDGFSIKSESLSYILSISVINSPNSFSDLFLLLTKVLVV